MGYKFLSFDDYYSSAHTNKRNCILTFDDGFYSTYKLLNEYLVPRQLPCQVYVVSDWVGKEGYINKKQIIEMNNEKLCTIGGHSDSHPMFRMLNRESSLNEMIKCKERIEDIVSDKIKEFAFPYGSMYACSRRDFENSRIAGFRYVYSTQPLCLKKKEDYVSNVIPRINGVEIIKVLRSIDK